jgi:hypothetical protein
LASLLHHESVSRRILMQIYRFGEMYTTSGPFFTGAPMGSTAGGGSAEELQALPPGRETFL